MDRLRSDGGLLLVITPNNPFSERCRPASTFILFSFSFFGAFLGPRFTKNPSQNTLQGVSAERARFELAIPFWGTHAFQACLFSHSSISPIRIPGNRDCKGNHFFRKCKCRRVNFSTEVYKVRLWSMQPGYSSG